MLPYRHAELAYMYLLDNVIKKFIFSLCSAKSQSVGMLADMIQC